MSKLFSPKMEWCECNSSHGRMGNQTAPRRVSCHQLLGLDTFPLHGMAALFGMLCGTWNSPKRKTCRHRTARKIHGLASDRQHPAALRIHAHPASWVRRRLFGFLCNCPVRSDAWKVYSLSTQLTEAVERHRYLISLPRGGFFPLFHLRTLCSDGDTRQSDCAVEARGCHHRDDMCHVPVHLKKKERELHQEPDGHTGHRVQKRSARDADLRWTVGVWLETSCLSDEHVIGTAFGTQPCRELSLHDGAKMH